MRRFARQDRAAPPDDRILAGMTRRIFYAGFSSKVIDGRWPGFEAAFDGFDPPACAPASTSDAQPTKCRSGR